MNNPYLLGLDVSKWQSGVNWGYAKSQGVKYAFIKAQEWYWTDAQFFNHWSGSGAVGVPRGAYLYYRDALVPETQAQKFYELLVSTGDLGELPPVLDVESYNNPTLTPAKVKKCLETLSALFGRAAIFYSRNDVIQTLGNPVWLLSYPLWLAQYTLVGWQTNHFEKVKQYPPTIPAPYPFYSVWQFSDKCPAITFQVTGSTTVDTNYAPEEIINGWTGIVPPPDPIGEPTMQFKTKIKYKIRSSPATPGDTNLVGWIPALVTIVAEEIRFTDNNSSWVRIIPAPAWLTKSASEYWVAGNHDGQGPFLDFVSVPPPEPVPVTLMQTVTNANLRWYKETNGQGKPIMSMPPAELRPKFLTGSVVACKPGKIDCDGQTDYYEVMNGEHATPKTYTPPTGYTGWFVSELDVFEVEP